MAEVIIQGINVKYRDLKEASVSDDGSIILGEEILYADLLQDEQYFRRIEDPFTDEDQLIEIAQLPYEER